MPSVDAPASWEVEFSSTIEVALVRAAASDADVVMAARVSTVGDRSLQGRGADASAGLIRYLMRDRHGSPFEHTSMTFLVHAPIFVFRELMRHRMASYNEESGRYRRLAPRFYLPDVDRRLVQVGAAGQYRFEPGTSEQLALVQREFRAVCTSAYASYSLMIEQGVAREVARGVLPVTIFSSAYVTLNARSLMNVLSLRRAVEGSAYPSFPQREIELVAEQLEAAWAALMPVTHAAFEENGRVAP